MTQRFPDLPDFSAPVPQPHLERRIFTRVDLRANGEFVWTTKSRLGRVNTNREYVTTKNVSIDGTLIVLPGSWEFPQRARGRLKLGIEFADVEVLEATPSGSATLLRLTFLSPSPRFVSVLEKWMPTETNSRVGVGVENLWK